MNTKATAEPVQTRGHPDVFLRTQFVTSGSKKFQKYIDYIDRSEAVRNEHFQQYSAYVDDYMDNPKKQQADFDPTSERASALFDAHSDGFTAEEKAAAKMRFQTAQKNGSPMWQTVLSFKNSFLAEHGIYDPQTGWVDNAKLRELTRSSMAAMLKGENMQGSAVWTASLHYNTKNLHIHVATVEPVPTRERVMYDGKLQYRGRLRSKTVRQMKSEMARSIIDQSEEMKKLQHLSRDLILKGRPEDVFTTDAELRRSFLSIYRSMPADRRLWKYNMNGIVMQRPLIDDLSKLYINKYHKKDYEEFVKELDRREAVYRTVYGEGRYQSYKDYKPNKIQDLYTRLGNAVLTEMRAFDHAQKQATQRAAYHPKSGNAVRQRFSNGAAVRRDVNKALQSLKKATKATVRDAKAQLEYQRLMYDVEKSERNSGPDV